MQKLITIWFPKKVWVMRGYAFMHYGLREVWVKRGSTVFSFRREIFGSLDHQQHFQFRWGVGVPKLPVRVFEFNKFTSRTLKTSLYIPSFAVFSFLLSTLISRPIININAAAFDLSLNDMTHYKSFEPDLVMKNVPQLRIKYSPLLLGINIMCLYKLPDWDPWNI